MTKALLLTMTGLALALNTATAADEKPAFKDPKEKLSYSMGLIVGGNLKNQGAEVDVDQISKGLRDGLAGGKSLLTRQEAEETMRAWQMEMRGKAIEQQKAQSETNRQAGDVFLAQNAKQPGVIALPSGLQYKVLAAGTGKTPASNDVVKAHYKGMLLDWTEFDSSYTTGQPLVRPANRLPIAGWTEALTRMKVGDKWQLFIPSKLAYGDRGSPPKIAPGATLIFEMELLGIEEPKPLAPATLPQK